MGLLKNFGASVRNVVLDRKHGPDPPPAMPQAVRVNPGSISRRKQPISAYTFYSHNIVIINEANLTHYKALSIAYR
jgi:hypothetical protein